MANGDADENICRDLQFQCLFLPFVPSPDFLLMHLFPPSEVFSNSWLRYWSLKLLSLPDCNSEQISLIVQSRRDWYQIIEVISYCQPCLLEDIPQSQPPRMWTILDHWRSNSTTCPTSPCWIVKRLYRKTDNEVGLYLYKWDINYPSEELQEKRTNSAMPVKGFLRMNLAPSSVYKFQYKVHVNTVSGTEYFSWI